MRFPMSVYVLLIYWFMTQHIYFVFDLLYFYQIWFYVEFSIAFVLHLPLLLLLLLRIIWKIEQIIYWSNQFEILFSPDFNTV